VKSVALWLWSGVCILAWYLICSTFVWPEASHKGTDLKISPMAGSSLVIKGSDINFEAGGCEPFAMFSQTEAIASLPADMPLGMDCSEYYHAAKRPFKPGTWTLASGGPDMHLTSESEITAVQEKSTEHKFLLSLLCALGAFGIWILGCIFGDEVLDIPDGMPQWWHDRSRSYADSSTSRNRR
jgi:hypothetical protein